MLCFADTTLYIYILGAQLVHFCKKNKKQVHFFLLFVYIGVKIVLCFYKVLHRKAQSLTPTIGFFQKIRIIYIERDTSVAIILFDFVVIS